MKNRLLAFFILISFYSLPGARAESVDAEACVRDELCHAQYKLARELSKAGQLSEALAAYESAYQRRAVPVLLYNMARLHHRLGHLPEAIRMYSRYLETQLISEAEQRARARQYLEDATKELQQPISPQRPSSALPVMPESNNGNGAEAKDGREPPAAGDPQAPKEMKEMKGPTAAQPQGTPAPAPTPAAPAIEHTPTIAASALQVASRSDERRPIYKRWWFWTVTGVAVAAVAVGLGVGLSRRAPAATATSALPAGINTYEPSF